VAIYGYGYTDIVLSSAVGMETGEEREREIDHRPSVRVADLVAGGGGKEGTARGERRD